jgi:serine/threonine protein kinase
MAQSLDIGDTFGSLKVVEHIAEGAKAVSYRASAQDGSARLLKQFHSPGSALKWFPAFVEHQLETHRRLKDSSVPGRCITMLAQRVESPFGLVQEYPFLFDSANLSAWIDRKEGLPIDGGARLFLARTLVATIARVHAAGVAHLDLKPANVLLRSNRSLMFGLDLYLIDFDFAIHRDAKVPWPVEWGFVGTDGYQSPEHFQGGDSPGTYSDVFTLGIILYELLGSGRPWFGLIDPGEYRNEIRRGIAPSFEPLPCCSDLPNIRDLSDLLRRSLSPKPELRPTAAQIHATLCAAPPVDTESRRDPVKPLVLTRSRVAVSSKVALVLIGSEGREMRLFHQRVIGSLQFTGIVGDLGRRASREHLLLAHSDSGCWIVSLCFGAAGTTLLNGQPMLNATNYELHHGDTLEIVSRSGSESFRVEVGA